MKCRLFGLGIACAMVVLGGCATEPGRGGETGAAEPAARIDYRVDGAAPAGAAPAGAAQAGESDGREVEYRIGPEDLLEIQVFGVPELSSTERVDLRGFVDLPLVGRIEAAGLTAEELEARIEAALAEDYLQEPDVSVFIREYTRQRVTVEGAVNKPGIYALRGQTTLLQAIAMAEGLGSLADPKAVKLFRERPDGQTGVHDFDLTRIRTGEAADPPIQGDDVVVVLRSRSRTFLRDSMFRDITDLLNPFRLVTP